MKWIKKRFAETGRFGKRGLIYASISLAGIVYELFIARVYQPFALILWLFIFGIGAYLIFFMKDTTR